MKLCQRISKNQSRIVNLIYKDIKILIIISAVKEECIYVKSHLGASRLDVNSEHIEGVFGKISLDKGDQPLLGCIYRSPNTNEIGNEEMRNLILLCSARSYSHFLLMGNFNYPKISWDPIRMPEDGIHPATLFVECLRDAYLYQHVTSSTHSTAVQKANILDLIMTNEELMVEDLTHDPPLGKSHHDCLVFNYRCYSKRNSNVQKRKAYMQKRNSGTVEDRTVYAKVGKVIRKK